MEEIPPARVNPSNSKASPAGSRAGMIFMATKQDPDTARDIANADQIEQANQDRAQKNRASICRHCDHGNIPFFDGEGNERGTEPCLRCGGSGVEADIDRKIRMRQEFLASLTPSQSEIARGIAEQATNRVCDHCGHEYDEVKIVPAGTFCRGCLEVMK